MDTLVLDAKSVRVHRRISKLRRALSRAGQRGVTLVEVLIVVAILSLIAGGVAIYAIPKYQQAQKDTAKTDAKTLVQVVETWKLNHPAAGGDCPTVESLKADKSLKPDQNTNDPWGKPYKIVCTGDEFGVMSSGPDTKEGSEDDIWAGTKPSK
jgi:general secretion pathway protein G